MTILYCGTKPRDFIRCRRDWRLLDDELEVHMVATKHAAHGYNRQTTYYFEGKNYSSLEPALRAFVEKNYKKYLPGI